MHKASTVHCTLHPTSLACASLVFLVFCEALNDLLRRLEKLEGLDETLSGETIG